MKKETSNLPENKAMQYEPVLPAVFQKELNKLARLNLRYKEQLDKVVDEIEKVFGKTPYEVDCDHFIDTYCTGAGNSTVQQLNEEMVLRCR